LADESTKASGSGDRAPFLTTGASFVRRTFGLLAALCFFGGESASKRKCLCAYPSAPKAHSGAYLEQPERAGILTARPRTGLTTSDLGRGNGSVTVASAATITTAATAIAAATASTRLAGPRLVHGQPPPVVILIVKTANCLLRLGIGVHFDKTEALAASRVTVGDDLSTLDRSELRKELLKIRTVSEINDGPRLPFRAERKGIVSRPKERRAEGRQRRREKIPERIDIANSTRSQPKMNYTTQPKGR